MLVYNINIQYKNLNYVYLSFQANTKVISLTNFNFPRIILMIQEVVDYYGTNSAVNHQIKLINIRHIENKWRDEMLCR